MVPHLQDPVEGGVQPQNVRMFLPVGGSGRPYFWLGDVGGDPTDGPHPGEFPAQSGKKSVGDATVEIYVWDLGISPTRRCLAGGRDGYNGDVNLQTPEYGRTVYCDATNS